MTMQFGHFGFQAVLHDNAASLSIVQDGPHLIIEETDRPPSKMSLIAGIAFSMCFVAFGLFIVSWELAPASEPLRFPAAGLFALIGLWLFWLVIGRKKTIRRLIANREAQTIEYGQMVAVNKDDWQYRKKGVLDYRDAERFDTGYVDHSAPGADLVFTGLYVKATNGPRNGLLIMGALYEIEIAIDHIYRHMNETVESGGSFGEGKIGPPRSFVPQNAGGNG
ncbi:hypothetical protein GCM10009096_20840 [Parasphingorhabdus litoris]|uniref:Uncharacterized protein n=1 Tax=Parasphingorhabdus litoris TaxID=394733 RepID=A0ABP3KFT5_9SPHN|nr:hypothetical protein [Parasphingorhabdus litoris]